MSHAVWVLFGSVMTDCEFLCRWCVCASSSQQPVFGEDTNSRKEVQLAASSLFFFAPCLVWVSSGCAHAPGRADDSIIMMKSGC